MFETTESPPKRWLEDLNADQMRAVTTDARSVLIVAGAGTGKTKTLASRVAYLMDQGVAPGRILLLTFTRRAAREMLGRAERLTTNRANGRPWGGTFHSVGNRLLRIYSQAVGLPGEFTVMDASDGADLMDMIRSDLGFEKVKRRFPNKSTLQSIYSATVNGERMLGDVLRKEFPWCLDEEPAIADIFNVYTLRKRAQGVLDYDDLLLYWRAMLELEPIKESIGAMFDHILVDEYQDTNSIQADILVGMRTPATSVMVVGDDAQAIYSFRAASVENILEFPKRHPDTEILILERNYRSTSPILKASNAVIAQASKRYVKDLWTERAEGTRPQLVTCVDENQQSAAVRDRILEHRERGVPLKSQAVLFRAGHHSNPLEIELARANIPFVKFGGLKFLEAAHVKDVMSFLRILENPYDELSWFRVLKLVEGVGPGTARRIIERIGVKSGERNGSPLVRFLGDESGPEKLGALRDALSDCVETTDVVSEIDRFRVFYDDACRRLYEGAEARLRDIEQLEGIAEQHGSRRKLLTELALDPPVSTGDLAAPPHLDDDYLILSTMHSAKGCEWDVVHVIHAADGMIPSDMAVSDQEGIDEELRLFYVALTRARNDLYVYFPLRYYHRRFGLDDPHSYGQLTRFLPDDILEHFARTSLVIEQAEDPTGPTTAAGSVDAFLQRLWSA
jgi:DNA helicase-2/ATP-dependent DNA helicase PcrA